MHELEPDEEYEYDTIQIIRKIYNSICFVGAGGRHADNIVINGFGNHSISLSHLIPLHGVRSKQDLCRILLNIASFPRTINFAFESAHF